MKNVIHSIPNQGVLETQLHNIFPSYDIINNARKELAIKNPLTGVYLEVDVWVPAINLCFEFQDEYHYNSSWFSHIPLSSVQRKDSTKRNNMLQKSFSLIVIPYWWDGNSASLQETITFYRPDLLLPQKHSPIPSNPASHIFEGHRQLMLASFPTAESINLIENSEWWVGEKWDGVRCFWNLYEKRLYSRHNVEIELPPSVINLLGNIAVDGELWCGRGFYYESQYYFVSYWDRLNNSLFRLLCFDDASSETQHELFETRYERVLGHFPPDHAIVINAPRFLSNKAKLLDALRFAVEGGGEGLILRKPNSLYLPGRSNSLFKIKASYGDQEALVIQVEDDGSLLLQLPNGFQFFVEKENCITSQRVARGDIVTFSFEPPKRTTNLPNFSKEYLYGAPAHPVVHRVRADLDWEDVRHSIQVIDFGLDTHQAIESSVKRIWEKQKLQSDQHKSFLKYFRIQPELDTVEDVKSRDVASWKKQSKRRSYFDKFALSRGMDQLNPLFWYSISIQDFKEYHVGYKGIAHYYGGKVSTALMKLYPDIGLQISHFKGLLWQTKASRKLVLLQMANFLSFDPSNVNNWYRLAWSDFCKFKPAESMILKHYGKYISALLDLLPELHLNPAKFVQVPLGYWRERENRRNLFCAIAKDRGFDPLVAANWYPVSYFSIRHIKGVKSVLQYYQKKLSRALLDLFPDIGFDPSKLKAKLVSRSWKLEHHRKAYFDKFAESKGMDPLNAVFWYTVTSKEILNSHPGYTAIVNYYGKKLSNALMSIYPDIGLKKPLFKGEQAEKANRRAVFLQFAASRSFDPLDPENWYRLSSSDYYEFKAARNMVSKYYRKSYTDALLDLFPDIQLKPTKFLTTPLNYWKNRENRRGLFSSIAQKLGFDPLLAANWYPIKYSTLKKFRRAQYILDVYYTRSVAKALMDTFPEIGLNQSRFQAKTKQPWKSEVTSTSSA